MVHWGIGKANEMTKNSIGYRACEYSNVKSQPWRLWVEKYTLVQLFSEYKIDFNNKQVGDFGSGTGLYSRLLIDLGAKQVLAIEGDSNMIKQAKKESQDYRDAIQYNEAWVQDTAGRHELDMILGSYLLSYPKTKGELRQYVGAISTHLSNGGIFIGFGNNTEERLSTTAYTPYGFVKVHQADHEADYDGAWVDWHIEGLSDPIRNYNLYKETYESVFLEYNMTLQWHAPKLHPSQNKNPIWGNFFKNTPPVMAMVATKNNH